MACLSSSLSVCRGRRAEEDHPEWGPQGIRLHRGAGQLHGSIPGTGETVSGLTKLKRLENPLLCWPPQFSSWGPRQPPSKPLSLGTTPPYAGSTALCTAWLQFIFPQLTLAVSFSSSVTETLMTTVICRGRTVCTRAGGRCPSAVASLEPVCVWWGDPSLCFWTSSSEGDSA